MAKTKISEWSTTPASNTDIDGINIAEGCAPSGINDAIRDLMAQVRSWQSGASGDPFNGPMNGTIGATTAYSGAFTTVSATGVITSTLATGTAPLTIASTTKVTNLNADLLDGADWASPAALGSTTPAAVSATTLSASGTVSGTGFSNYLASPPAIGGTTAAAGSFTTLTTSSTVTLNGGTANGVTYLNGSKVLTSGSALTFDGTNLGVGTSSPSAPLTVKTSSGYLSQDIIGDATNGWASMRYRNAANSATTVFFNYDNGAYKFGTVANEPIVFNVSNAEQMRLTSTGLGIGTSSPSAKLQVNGSETRGVGTGFFYSGYRADGTTRQFYLGGSDSQFYINVDQSVPITIANGGTERVRIDTSGNVGIGTSSPLTNLQIQATNQIVDSYGNIYVRTSNNQAINLGGQLCLGGAVTDTGTGNGVFGAIAGRKENSTASNYAGYLQFSTSASGGSTAERMRLDSAGNLGLGVTPSAWGSNFKAIQVNDTGASLWSYRSGATSDEYLYLSNNSYNNNTNDIYIRDGAAVQYRQLSGTHAWFNSASGTAGGTISFTQAMTLDANGYLLVGGTSSVYAAANRTAVEVNGTSQSMFANNIGGTNGGYLYHDGTNYTLNNVKTGALLFSTNNTEKMRLDSSGNLGLGVTNPASYGKFNVATTLAEGDCNNYFISDSTKAGQLVFYDSAAQGVIRYDHANDAMSFKTAGTERARITSGGDVYINTQTALSSTAKLQISNGTGRAIATAGSTGDVSTEGLRIGKFDNNSTTSQLFVRFTINNDGAGSGQINANGASAAAFGTYSDERLKENIVNLPSQLSNICALRPVEFDYKDGSGHQIGFIAQEMQAIYPDVVAPSDDEMLMVTGWSKTEARLVKAIQDLKAEFDAYKASHP